MSGLANIHVSIVIITKFTLNMDYMRPFMRLVSHHVRMRHLPHSQGINKKQYIRNNCAGMITSELSGRICSETVLSSTDRFHYGKEYFYSMDKPAFGIRTYICTKQIWKPEWKFVMPWANVWWLIFECDNSPFNQTHSFNSMIAIENLLPWYFVTKFLWICIEQR